MTPSEKEEIAKLIGWQFFFADEIKGMTTADFTSRCRKAAEAVAERRDHLVANLRNQITDAETALTMWDEGRSSEYWERHHPEPL